jgi:hypothetical protein
MLLTRGCVQGFLVLSLASGTVSFNLIYNAMFSNEEAKQLASRLPCNATVSWLNETLPLNGTEPMEPVKCLPAVCLGMDCYRYSFLVAGATTLTGIGFSYFLSRMTTPKAMAASMRVDEEEKQNLPEDRD